MSEGTASDEVAAGREARSRRGVVAIAVSLVILLQSLVAVAPAFAHIYKAGETGLIASLLDGICAKNIQSDHQSPQHHADHAQCCILCSSAGGFGPPAHGLSEISGGIRFASQGPALLLRRQSGGGRPVGWASTWSSRAPPHPSLTL
ncbi:hypothetical protein [Methylocystis heyeri]|uniref:DUF2946 domain-containing protein n=1 Tax=Methylocystis heyeri TaxID=391905 RepID=A0A6B8KD41_9HYPH|nr:hypothetical protein [Methylocystis heyeri]QGM44343.1 hypothetical protein H2LOC_000745 [Methylocystis heyeri]